MPNYLQINSFQTLGRFWDFMRFLFNFKKARQVNAASNIVDITRVFTFLFFMFLPKAFLNSDSSFKMTSKQNFEKMVLLSNKLFLKEWQGKLLKTSLKVLLQYYQRLFRMITQFLHSNDEITGWYITFAMTLAL